MTSLLTPQVWKQKFLEYKTLVTLCFGYSVDVVGSGERYRLQPVIEGVGDNFFLVEFNQNQGTVMLIETPFTSQWNTELQEYLAKFDSYPAFFATVVTALVANAHRRRTDVMMGH